MMEHATNLLVPQALAWYGKLPSRGDFVSRGLPRSWSRSWDEWLQRGLALAAPVVRAAGPWRGSSSMGAP